MYLKLNCRVQAFIIYDSRFKLIDEEDNHVFKLRHEVPAVEWGKLMGLECLIYTFMSGSH